MVSGGGQGKAMVMPAPTSSVGWKKIEYLETKRPWLSIYGTRVRPVPPVGSISSKPVLDSAPLHRVLPDELLQEVTGWEENERIVQKIYGGSWRAMWQHRPRLRFDGLYVSRNTYVRAGIAEWRITNPVHLVCYFRYIRFYPSGKFLYKTTPLRLKEVAKYMQSRPSKSDGVYGGRCILNDDQVDAAILYTGLKPTVLRIRLRLRGTVAGANNRLDVLALVTCGVDNNEMCGAEDVMDTIEGWQDDETHDPDVPAISHRRGMAPFVFVPFEEVETSVLNLPVETMDYYVPG